MCSVALRRGIGHVFIGRRAAQHHKDETNGEIWLSWEPTPPPELKRRKNLTEPVVGPSLCTVNQSHIQGEPTVAALRHTISAQINYSILFRDQLA